jgi:hypothetical protein
LKAKVLGWVLKGILESVARKNQAAAELGRKGGRKRVPKGFSMMGEKNRKAIARAAIRARWEKWRADNPDKWAASEERRRKRAKRPVKTQKTALNRKQRQGESSVIVP